MNELLTTPTNPYEGAESSIGATPLTPEAQRILDRATALDSWSDGLITTEEGVYHANEGGVWKLPPGLGINVWSNGKNGKPESRPHYVTADNNIKPLRLDEEGNLPPEVVERMKKLEENRLARQEAKQATKVIPMTRTPHGHVPPGLTDRDLKKIEARLTAKQTMATLKDRAESTTRRSALRKVAHSAAAIAMKVLGISKPTGRHHKRD